MHGAEMDLLTIDGAALPLALLVIAIILKSPRLLLLPVLSIVVSILVSYSIMFGVAQSMSVIAFAPAMMMSASIAMSIDYSLFLLSRYREELVDGNTNRNSVFRMMMTAGHTITVSGITLAICFLGLMIFKVDLLVTTGLGTALAILTTLFFNLLLLPTMLLRFPNFFSKCKEPWVLPAWCPSWMCCGKCKRTDDSDNGANNYSAVARPGREASVNSDGDYTPLKAPVRNVIPDDESGMSHHEKTGCWYRCTRPIRRLLKKYTTPTWHTDPAELENLSPSARKSYYGKWHKFGVLVVRTRWLIIAIVMAVAIPTSYFASQMEISNDIVLFAPRTYPSYTGAEKLNDAFGENRLHPFQLMFKPPDGVRITSLGAYEMAYEFVNDVIMPFNVTTQESFLSSLYAGIYWVALEETFPYNAESFTRKERVDGYYLLLKSCDYIESDQCKQINQLKAQYVAPLDNIAKMDISLIDIDTFQTEGTQLIGRMRAKIEEYVNNPESKGYKYTILISGDGPLLKDLVDDVYNSFPTVITVTCALVFLIMGAAFQSVVLPLRTILSIAVTIAYVYGSASLVYSYDILGGMGFAGLSGDFLIWVAPIISFSIMVGLSLDYEVFLIERIIEFRKNGVGETESIIMGLSMTGSIITAAGAIMAIAFAGLLFSSSSGLNQLSFFLVICVVVDTLVVRMLFVPACMAVLGRINWLPRKYSTSGEVKKE